MLNNKFHFEFQKKKKTPKIEIFFSLYIQKKNLQLWLIFKVYPFYLFNFFFLNYNRCKLLTFTQKNRKASQYVRERMFRG